MKPNKQTRYLVCARIYKITKQNKKFVKQTNANDTNYFHKHTINIRNQISNQSSKRNPYVTKLYNHKKDKETNENIQNKNQNACPKMTHIHYKHHI